MSDIVHITLDDAVDLIRRALLAAKVSDQVAASVAEALVAAEAEGQVGHGFSRLGDYVAQVRSGKINGSARITTTAVRPGSLLTDADRGFAYPALDSALDAGLPVAAELGIAIMAVANSHHCGALSVQVEKIARAGLIGIMVANSPKAIAPWGASRPLFGTNPIAFACPRADAAPLVIDLSLSKVARGKVMNAYKSGVDIPQGWALDVDGKPTTDAKAALDGTMLPIGDAKGTALALMVEILAAVLTGSALSCEAGSFFEAEGASPRVGQTFIAIHPGVQANFFERLEALLGLIGEMEGARLPGARRAAAIERAAAEGLTVSARYVDLARGLADGA